MSFETSFDGPFGAPAMGDPTVQPNTFIGQHILRDPTVLERAVELIPAGAPCVEIGPGPGTLTERLLTDGHRVVAYEVDERWQGALDTLAGEGDLEVHWGNFLDADNDELSAARPLTVVGNIPFHISEPLMFKLAELPFDVAVLLVGDRLARALTTANPDNPGWSRMSLVSNAYFNVERVLDVPRESFDPVPRADGALIRLTRKDATDEWHADATTRTYRALIEAGRANSTMSKALKSVMVTPDGRAERHAAGGRRSGDTRSQRRTTNRALSAMAGEYNNTGRLEHSAGRSPISQSMLSIVGGKFDERVLNRPLSGVSNGDLRSICSAVSTAVNRRLAQRH
ncbi:MAG TPA: rRNA adenine dimethyltransferase family protein [Patescibacteria group bacterium]|nr:rRNA adenine dimethyltransferase family protein [Patescibacteria group bacterium]